MDLYASPMNVRGPEECHFYHSINLPSYGEIPGGWDLRPIVDKYIGEVDVSGLRVLDMGAATGFMTFEMERRGAEVVSFEIDKGENWDLVPHYKKRDELKQLRSGANHGTLALKRGYWLCHKDLGSKAKAFYGNIYNLPKELGDFDLVFYGMILTHLRDPFQALYSGARLSRDRVVVTGIFSADTKPVAVFRPNPELNAQNELRSWWLLSIGTVRNMLGVLGFEVERIVEFDAEILQADRKGMKRCQAVVARRPR